MNKCIGCGAILQSTDINKDGFIDEKNIDLGLCRRCFRLKNYNEYSFFNKDNNYYKNILNDIKESKELVVHVVDFFNLYNSNMFDDIKRNSILVLTKRDVLPRSLNDRKLLSIIRRNYPNYLDYVIVSSTKNYNFDLLFEKILKRKKSNIVYFVGYTNSGKSSLINRIIRNYSKNKSNITTSYYPSTTLDKIEIEVNDELKIIDTPGLLEEGNIINSIDIKLMKKVVVENEIHPRIFQVYDECSIYIDEFCKVNYINKNVNDIVIYCSNNLEVNKQKINMDKGNFKELEFSLNNNEDLVVSGLCFIKTKNNSTIKIYVPEYVNVYKRYRLI